MKEEIQETLQSGAGKPIIETAQESFGSIKAVIFDMDGVLIDSEPFWREAEIVVFKRVGIELTESMCFETMGLRVDEVVNYWYGKQPWDNFVPAELEERIIDAVVERIVSEGRAKDGAAQAIEHFRGKGFKIALASSSPYRIIQAVVQRLGIAEKFDCIYSAEEEEYGKPHPGVYLTTARKLSVGPSECLAIEDSLNGVLAAKAARMKCIAVPEDLTQIDRRFVIADLIFTSLLDFNDDDWQQISSS